MVTTEIRASVLVMPIYFYPVKAVSTIKFQLLAMADHPHSAVLMPSLWPLIKWHYKISSIQHYQCSHSVAMPGYPQL